MKSITPFSTWVFLLLAASVVQGQGFRSGAVAGRSAGTFAPANPSAPQTFQSRQSSPAASTFQSQQSQPTSQTFQGSGLPASPAQQPGASMQQHRTWIPAAPTTQNPVHSGPVLVTPPSAAVWVPRSNWRHVPQRLHRPRHFHSHVGGVIIGVPYVVGTTVITEVAPGVVRAERRYVEESPADMPERSLDRLAPFDPTPQEVVERILALAGVRKNDLIYDLGAGDGRVLITAAKKYGARGVGFEIDAGLVKLARENARRAGVEKLVEIRQQDFLSANLSPASVVTLYLSYDGNLAVRERLNRQLKPGSRVVSYTFDMGDWPPKIAESYRDAAGDSHSLYLWEIGAPTLASRRTEPMLRPQPTRNGPLIIDVR
jgi:precorrin-6B methylase 2